jgi:hypothetical protein
LALRNAGYRGAVFDKDNCLVSHENFDISTFLKPQQTIPHKDTLVPQLEVSLKGHKLKSDVENLFCRTPGKDVVRRSGKEM